MKYNMGDNLIDVSGAYPKGQGHGSHICVLLNMYTLTLCWKFSYLGRQAKNSTAGQGKASCSKPNNGASFTLAAGLFTIF
jgi:hypothetical protein